MLTLQMPHINKSDFNTMHWDFQKTETKKDSVISFNKYHYKRTRYIS